MADFSFGDEMVVQGRPVKIYMNGDFEFPKTLSVQMHWQWDDFLCAVTQRLEMAPKAQRAFNVDGAEINDLMCIEDDDMIFFSSGDDFRSPSSSNALVNKNGKASHLVGGYQVDKFLGKGGFGEVRLGIHQLTGDKVALKFILKSEMGSLGDVERTITEIQCLAALNHPNIIKLLSVMNEREHLVLCIELLEGGDLHHYLRDLPDEVMLEEEESRILFHQVVAGVGYAHNQHICHRDMKLENILLARPADTSTIKIADFGLSDFYRPGAVMKTNCGSLSYLAPEILRGSNNSGPPLDVWSMGVILYAILFRRLPFDGPDLKGTNRPKEKIIQQRILAGKYILHRKLSLEVQSLLSHLLKLDPADRATISDIFNHPWMRGTRTYAAEERNVKKVPEVKETPTVPEPERTTLPPIESSLPLEESKEPILSVETESQDETELPPATSNLIIFTPTHSPGGPTRRSTQRLAKKNVSTRLVLDIDVKQETPPIESPRTPSPSKTSPHRLRKNSKSTSSRRLKVENGVKTDSGKLTLERRPDLAGENTDGGDLSARKTSSSDVPTTPKKSNGASPTRPLRDSKRAST